MDGALPDAGRLAARALRIVRFSVVIPTLQRRDLVQRTVLALAEQDFDDFEVIVVDDGSRDGTAAALRSLSVPFALRVLEQENRGAGSARNAGAAVADADTLLFLDDDMVADPSLLLEHEQSHAQGADLVLGDLPLHPESPQNLLSRGVERWARSRTERLAAADHIPLGDLLTGQMSISRALFQKLGGFDAGITRNGRFGGEDIDFGYRVTQAGCRVVFNPDARSHQYYDVDPRAFLRRTYESARAHQELALKHPEQAREFEGDLRFGSARGRWLSAPLIVAPAAFSWPLRAALAALVRHGYDGPRLRRAFLMMRIFEHTRGVRDARRALGTGQVVVLAYHAVTDLRGDPVLAQYGVPPARLAAQLDNLRRHSWTFVDFDAVLDALAGQRPLPKRAVLVTFDDCYADLLSAGAGVLGERGIPAVAFAVTGLLGATNQWDLQIGARELRLLDADELRQLGAHRIEIGSHGAWHRALTKVPSDELEDELMGSAVLLQEAGLPRPRALSYPYGDFSPTVAGAAHRAGYDAAFTTEPGVVRRHSERTALPRIEVHATDTPRRVRLLVSSAGWPEPIRRRVLRLLRTRS